MPVAAFGRVPDLAAWRDVADGTGLPVIVDGAAAFDGLRGAPVPVTVSLHATKSVAAGEGGYIASEDHAFIEQVRALSAFGFSGSRISRDAGHQRQDVRVRRRRRAREPGRLAGRPRPLRLDRPAAEGGAGADAPRSRSSPAGARNGFPASASCGRRTGPPRRDGQGDGGDERRDPRLVGRRLPSPAGFRRVARERRYRSPTAWRPRHLDCPISSTSMKTLRANRRCGSEGDAWAKLYWSFRRHAGRARYRDRAKSCGLRVDRRLFAGA